MSLFHEDAYVDIIDPARKPSLDDLAAGSADKVIFGTIGGPIGILRFLALLIFLLGTSGCFFVWLLT